MPAAPAVAVKASRCNKLKKYSFKAGSFGPAFFITLIPGPSSHKREGSNDRSCVKHSSNSMTSQAYGIASPAKRDRNDVITTVNRKP
jgi:hypothetical protein